MGRKLVTGWVGPRSRSPLGLAELHKLDKPAPYKLLALDGGGIRGVLMLEVLAGLERMLRVALRRDQRFVLADYFDYIAGTSTGAIIATCLALGFSVEQIRRFYLENGRDMFDRASLLQRFRYRYEDDRLAERLKAELGPDRTLGSPDLRTLLLIVMRNASTDSPWPISNNPRAKYNDFTYMRYNAELTHDGLRVLGLPDIEPRNVQRLDSVAHVAELQQIGQAVARQVRQQDFAGFLD